MVSFLVIHHPRYNSQSRATSQEYDLSLVELEDCVPQYNQVPQNKASKNFYYDLRSSNQFACLTARANFYKVAVQFRDGEERQLSMIFYQIASRLNLFFSFFLMQEKGDFDISSARSTLPRCVQNEVLQRLSLLCGDGVSSFIIPYNF